MLDGPDGVDPLFGGEGRDLKLSEPELPPSGALPSETDRGPARRPIVPVRPPQLPPGPTDPAFSRRRSPSWSAWSASNR